MRVLRAAALLLGDEIRLGDGLALLLAAAREGSRDREAGPKLVHDAHRGAVLPLRCAPRARLRRWAQAHRAALLHEQRRAEFEEALDGSIFPSFSRRRRMEPCVRAWRREISGIGMAESNSATRVP